MKKMVMSFVVVLAFIGVLCGEDLQINGDFKLSSKKLPQGWGPNKSDWAKPFGKVKKVKVGVKKDENALQITSTEQPTHVFYKKYFPVKAGDVASISIQAKGKGKVGFGFYVYGKKHYYMTTHYAQKSVNDSFVEFKKSFTIENQGRGEVKTIRVVVWAAKGSDIVVKDIKAGLAKK